MRRSALGVLLAIIASAVAVALAVHRPARPKPADGRESRTVTSPLPRIVPAAAAGITPAAVEYAGPTTVVAGIPMGYAHSPAGAEAAALEFVAGAGALMAMDEAAALEAQRTMAASDAAETLVRSLKSQLDALRQGFPGPVSYRVAPVATRVDAAGSDEVAVTVWYVGVVTAAGVSPYEDWRMVRYRLIWERGDWRVAAEEDTRGPRPAALPQVEPTGAAELDAALAGFARPRSSR